MRRARMFLLSVPIALSFACGGGDEATVEPTPTIEVQQTDQIDLTPEASSAGRQWRRMNIDQINKSLQQVSGGIGWTEVDENGGEIDLFDRLAGSLGKPDYLNSNVEELTPGMLFQKFLDDAATSVCDRWMARERTQPANDRLLLVHAELGDTPDTAPEAIEANMRQALLRFHGRPVIEGDAMVEPWLNYIRMVYQDTGDMERVWTGACVALFTHPDFYTF